jgi:acid phosphatase
LVLPVASAQAATKPKPKPVPTDKVLVIVIENHALVQIKKEAPFTYGLGTKYGLATNMQAITHPSKPNYAIITMGETRGLTSDSGKTTKGPTVFGATIKAGRTAKIMAEAMGTDRCRTDTASKYVPRHNPWTYNTEEKALCESQDFSYDTYGASDIAAGKLGNVEMLIPNQCNNAHDCSLGTFDNWMKTTWERIIAGPDWKANRLTVVITADEDDRKHGNVIPLMVINPYLSHKVVTSKLTLYSLNRLLTDFGHVPHMAGGKTAPDMAKAFGLQIG